MSKQHSPTGAGEVQVGILYGHGINADRELGTAFQAAGGSVQRISVKHAVENPDVLDRIDILGFPGGFSFGDHLGSGLVLAQWIRTSLRPAIERLIDRGGLVLGICNGFQVLVKMGLLPNLDGDWNPSVSLVHNDSGRFIDTWVPVEWSSSSRSPWLQQLPAMMLPIRHGEGRFTAASEEVLQQVSDDCVALRYRENPNGSVDNIAGITDRTGRVLGLMPHPEAFIRMTQHPQWQRLQRAGADAGIFPTGLELFRNGIKAIHR
ncbi:phosphoribosylformylglycinamidine synthase subunit PurQ [Spirochaeta africana]|uniref:Phosphoribosylformylglycinamidine (FGAM) synthase, glutamine amidotransferase domain protein n=1 Tax=Spirochaeta africana (strain ATCC 700263 / DSM 8902 / Z-7692) TaxID=889378 RepID=H9UFA5_SPIAZ|nr:phosphoribosylformylglycinamidine synthase subunit PurQ [Spirochaeta africana]AFG36198.1 phosphoribosylformylglycinamidine (FGAM) synthase, glutamine amidotransferase domain protein [Spirochaeta africana DSM 8902]